MMKHSPRVRSPFFPDPPRLEVSAVVDQMYLDTVGWGGTSRLRRESVVLVGQDAEGPVDLAIAPGDKDVEQLRRALAEAGVLGES
jgi:hypothetical protein